MTLNNQDFNWKCHPQAEAFCQELLNRASQANSMIASLSDALLQKTSTRLFDWIDHFDLEFSRQTEEKLGKCGYLFESATAEYRVYSHPGAQLPRIVLHDHTPSGSAVAVNVESISDFLMVRGVSGWIEGTPFSAYRRCSVAVENGVSLWVVERRASWTMEPSYYDPSYLERYFEAKELWKTRLRHSHEREDELITHTIAMASELVALVGQDLAAWIVLECEREYWQARNHAAQVQKARQDCLGMGWANHDHHTFRSSRAHFAHLIRLFEVLGFISRERFYAGTEAGWGAQVMENPRCKLVLFLDVDLLPHEIEIDFAHQVLPEAEKLGTVGLWCALHGDSILGAGMHHLEAQFMFDSLKEDLAKSHVHMMAPFSHFPYLMQAFTVAEMWPVESKQIDKLLHKGGITQAQADKFRAEGALGSHLENLQRREGYKGFNQKNVSVIIRATDPRQAT